jgi:hypothetical protein
MFREDAMTAGERQRLSCTLDTMSMIRLLERLRELG